MKAELLPLNGKYYGTKIKVFFDDGGTTTLELWYTDGEPSTREIESWGHTQKEWDENALVDNWGCGKERIKEMDYRCDSHYESKTTYDLAQLIVSAINERGE